MNDFSENKYYIEAVNGKNRLEFAPERHVSRDEAELLAGCVVAMHGFSLHLSGTRYLVSLLDDYLFDDGFCFENSITALAKDDEVEYEYVISCILSSIEHAPKFDVIAAKLLEQKIEFPNPLIYGVLEIMGAVFKIYYNCVIDDAGGALSEEIEE